MHPPAPSTTCNGGKEFSLRRKSTDSEGTAGRHNQICWGTQRITISIPFSVIGSRYVAEHLSLMHPVKIINLILLTVIELCWILTEKGRQGGNAAPGPNRLSIHGAALCSVRKTPPDWPSDSWELLVDSLRGHKREQNQSVWNPNKTGTSRNCPL